MKKIFALAMVAAAALAGCKKDSEVKLANDFTGPETVEVPYNGSTVDLNTLFVANGPDGTFSFALSADTKTYVSSPAELGFDGQMGTDQNVGTVFSYDAATRTVKSIAKVIPDALKAYVGGDNAPSATATDMKYDRTVKNPDLIVTMTVGAQTFTKNVKLVQSNKPANYRGTPTIAFTNSAQLKPGTTADNRKVIIAQTGTDAPQAFADYFTVTPIDFDYAVTRIVVRKQTAASAYMTSGATGILAGATEGSGDYVFAFYMEDQFRSAGHESETEQQYEARVVAVANAAEATEKGRVYVDVVAGSKPAALLARTVAYNAEAGLTKMAFTKAGQKMASMAAMVEMGDGTYVALNDTKVTNTATGWGELTWLAGDFSGNIKGMGAVDGDHAGWFPNVGPNTFTAGQTGTFTLTAKEHFMEAKYTVTITVNHEPMPTE